VIIVGIRSDLADRATGTSMAVSGVTRTVDDAIGMMPKLRSGLSRGRDDPASWRREVVEAARLLAGINRGKEDGPLRDAFSAVAGGLKDGLLEPRLSARRPEGWRQRRCATPVVARTPSTGSTGCSGNRSMGGWPDTKM